MSESIKQLARLLLLRRPDELAASIGHLEELSGATGIAERVWSQNQERFEKKLKVLKVKSGATSREQYQALLAQVGRAEGELSSVAQRHGFGKVGEADAMERLLS